ncbi:DUF721 domain-containing protein [Streptacidiphilus sp. 4-A2]|nr:DUF721 domain-containing protein [Streptacidiphilus sp. 4-A2]
MAQVPLDLAVALSPVIGLWWRVKRRGERAVIVAAARAELAAVAERTDPTSAPGLLAERLAFRLGRQGAVDSVRDPVGWLLRRGLPQGRQCGDVRCDDGTLLTDGSTCPRCEDNRTCRRRERQQVTEDVDRRLPHATAGERRDAVEQRMRELAGIEAELQQIRRERAAAAPAWWTCTVCERSAPSTPPPSGVAGAGPSGRGWGGAVMAVEESVQEAGDSGPQDAAGPRVSGADLAKMALQAAKASARQRGDQLAKQRKKPVLRSRPTGTGREPVGFAAVLQGLVDQGAWAVPVAGGGVLDQWPSIAPPEWAGHVQAVAFDADSGQLQLRPESASYAASVRMQTPALLRRIADHAGPSIVRHIKVLAPGQIAAARPVPVPAADGPGRGPRSGLRAPGRTLRPATTRPWPPAGKAARTPARRRRSGPRSSGRPRPWPASRRQTSPRPWTNGCARKPSSARPATSTDGRCSVPVPSGPPRSC